MTRVTLTGGALVALLAIAGCTGGDMGNTRGGGAAPGQSGGTDTSGAHSASGASMAAGSATGASARADTTRTPSRARRP